MALSRSKKFFFATALCASLVITQAFSLADAPTPEKAKNLKVLPKKTSLEDIHTIMRGYSMALGVRCGFCHASAAVTGDEKPHLDFASDAKPEKTTARGMMKMTAKINKKYLRKIGHGNFEQITCVTCHMGRAKPIISTDSLAVRR